MNSTTAKVISALLIGVVTVILYKVFRKWLRSLAAPKKQTDSEKISKESPSESDDYSSGEIVHVKKQVCDRKHHRQFRYCDDLLDKTVLDKMVLDNLITECILMIEDREEVIKPTTQSERNRVLLDILTERPYGTYDVFIDVIKKSGTNNEDVKEIVSRMECTKNSDETISCHDIIFHEHIVKLQKNYTMFVHNVDCRTDIADYLYANDVLNNEEREEISNSSLTSQDSNRILYDKFFRKGKDAYRHLIEALRHGECYEVASNMEETKVSDHELELCKRGMKKLRERHRKKEDLTRIHDEVIPTHILDCFPEDPSNVECIEGDDATMTCKVRPGSQPVRWMKDGNEIRQNENCKMYNEDTQYIIQLKNTTTSDSGEYLVQVGQFSSKLHLTIIDCFPEDPSNVEFIEGEDAIMTCKVRPGSQPVKWMKDGNEIRQNANCKMYNEDTQYSLKLTNTITSNSGEYCVQVGQLSRKLHLRIIGIPGEITKGERKTYMDAIQSGTEVRKYVRIQVIGKDRVGKTSLVHRLLGYKKHDGKSTDGIEIDRKCLIKESDGEWILGDVATERKKNERIITILQGDNIKGKGTKPVSDTPLISDEHVLDTKKKLNKKEPNKIEEDNLLQKEKQKHISTKKEKVETESLKFHEALKKTDVTNITKDIPAASKSNSDKSVSNIADRFSSSEEKRSITKKPKEKQMKNSEQKPGPSILSPQNQNPINSDEADKLTGETNKKIDKILLRAKNKKEKMTLNGLVESGIWDFAGQKDYYATHQTFFTPQAIYLLVADIEDAITGTEGDGNVNFDTIGDYIDFWFDSIHCFCSDPSAVKLCPHVIVVCTGTDKVPEIEKKKAEYKATFIRILGSQQKADHSRGIHFISNMVPQKDEIEHLKKHISNIAEEGNYFAEELPTRWINLEIALDVLKDLNETVSSWKDIEKLALAYLIEEQELLLFLNYQHKIGNIIFFEDERDFIILQPNWLVKCFRCLVCDDDKKHFGAGLVSEMFKLTHEGELSENLIDELFKKEPDLKFGTYKHHILNVMGKFDIIVKPCISNTSNNSYYMPCMIKNSSTLQAIMENNFAFENPHRTPWLVLEFKFLPIAYFNHILFNYIRNYKVCKVKSLNLPGDEHLAIYPEKAVVYLDKTESRLLIICFSKNAISLQINVVILNNLCRKIAELQRKLMHNLTYEIKAKCSTGNYKMSTGRISYGELITQRKDGKYLCKEDNKLHSSEDIENSWLKYAANTVMSKTPEVTPETQLQEPAASVVEDSVEKGQQSAMLNRLLGKGSYESFDMRCMVTGQFSVGKSTLVKLLAGDVIPEGRHPTDGISVVEGRCGLDIETKSWILIDPEAYNALDVVYNKVLMTSLEEDESELTENLDQALDTSPTGYAKATLSSLPSQQSAAAKPLPPHKSSNVPLTVKQMKGKMKTRMTKEEIRRNMEKVLRSGKYKMKVGRLNFWDFSGHYVYLTTHQTFMTFRALFLVVFDGSKDLHEQVPDVMCFPGQHMTPTPADFLQYWVNSILTYCKVVYARIPQILFVATHKDKVPKENVETRREELYRGIEELFKDHEGQHHLVLRPLIFVNAKNQDDPEIEILKKTITELTFDHPCWGVRMPNAFVPLELEIAELVAEGKQIMSLAEVKELNAISEVSVLSPEQLTYFLHYQHSIGKIVYFDTPQLRDNVIISPLLMVEVMRSFITDIEFWPKGDKTRKTFKKMSENGMIQKVNLYQIWKQEEFRQILTFKEYIFDMLIQLDIVSEQRRYDTKTGSRLPVEHFFVPCMLTQRNYTDFLTQECTPDRTVSLAFVFKGTIIPSALPNRLICACLSMWPLKEYRGRKLMFSGFVGLSFDKEHDIVVCVEGNKILLCLVHKRSKGLIVSDIATSVRECLYITLERISEFYQSTIHCNASNKLPFHTEYCCSKLRCFTPEDTMVLETEECLCKHGENIKHNWRVWNQKLEQMQCDLSCPGLSDDALSQIPSNTELLRLSVNLETRMLHQLALHLGMEEMVWNDMEDNYPGNIQVVKFLTLMHLKENDEISFAELDNGLREMEITTHKLCVVRRRKQVKSSIPDDILDCIPSDEILDRLAPLIGKIVFQLGIELGLSVEEIDYIKEKFDRDVPAQNKEVLCTWKNDRTVKPTIRVLEQAFVNISKGSMCLKEVVKDIDPHTLKAVETVTDRIRENENRIIQDIQISQILDHMMTHLVISVDDRRRIEQHAGQDDQNKALLDIVIKRREPTYSVFVDGLRYYGYEDIANDLICDSQEMSSSIALVFAEIEGISDWKVPLYKVRLQKNYLKIITDIQHESIVDHLITRTVVSVDDWEKIESGKTLQEQNRTLMDMLLRKNERGFIEFLKALRKDSMYADLADQIEKTEVTSRDIAILHKCLK